MDSKILIHRDVSLRAPVLIAAFKGWNDAGDAATFAASHLGRVWSAERFAEIDPEDFYDFQDVRPTVRLVDGVSREIVWPPNEFLAAHLDDAPQDVIVLVGTEPNTHWRTFTDLIVEVATTQGVKLVITMGALLADVPHSRPVPITGTAVEADLVRKLGLHRSRYEGPTGIVGVLHDACSRAGIDSASLWAAVPHYIAVTPNPKAALVLVEKVSELVGIPADVDPLHRAVQIYEQRVDQLVEEDEDVRAYVRLLEERADDPEGAMDGAEMPTGEDLAAELERFLQERGETD